MGKIKRIGSIILPLAVSAALLVFLFLKMKVDVRAVFDLALRANKSLLVLGLILTYVANAICYFRWKMLLNGAEVYPSGRKLLTSYCGGIFFNVCPLSTFGGDFVRGFDLAQSTEKKHEVVASIIVDRLSGYTGMMIVALFGVMLGFKIIGDSRVMLGIGGLIGFLGLILVLIFNDGIYTRFAATLGSFGGRISRAIKRVHEEVYFFRGKKRLLLKNLFLSVLIQLLGPLSSYMVALALGINVNPAYFLVFLPIVTAISALPISMAGLGIRDWIVALFLARIGITQNASVALSQISFYYVIIVAITAGVSYVLAVHRRRL